MRRDHFQLYDSLRGLGLSFAITIAVGLFVAFILRDGTSVGLPLFAIASAMCSAITFISFLIYPHASVPAPLPSGRTGAE